MAKYFAKTFSIQGNSYISLTVALILPTSGMSYPIFFSLSASQPIVGLYSQPFSGLLASSFEVSRSQTTTRHSR